MKIKNNMQLLTKCVDIYFKNNVDKSTVYIIDEFEAFLPLFHNWIFLRMLHHSSFVVYSRILQCYFCFVIGAAAR